MAAASKHSEDPPTHGLTSAPTSKELLRRSPVYVPLVNYEKQSGKCRGFKKKKTFLPLKYRRECLAECEYPSVILFDHMALRVVYFEGGNSKNFSTLI